MAGNIRPGSRIGGSMLHTAAEACGARVIAVDRPGFGASPFSPQHTVANWAGMVQHLADHLQIEQFSVLGVSGGGPFAASCGRFIPAERLTALGLLCPVGPINRTTKAGMAAANALLMAIARFSPMLARGIWRASRQWMLWDEQCMSRFALLEQDKAAMQAAPHVAQAIRAAVLEGLRAGARGVVHEMKLVQRCWGFRLEDIAVKQSFMWHGLKDPIVPYGMAQAYECIPGCHMTYFADETHTTIVINRLSAALKTLAQLQQPTATTLMKSAAAGKGGVDVAE
eukprot:gene7354-7565_t